MAITKAETDLLSLTLSLPDLILSNTPYCLPYSSYDVSKENLVLDQLTIAQLIFLFILITSFLDIVLILKGEILFWSELMLPGLTL